MNKQAKHGALLLALILTASTVLSCGGSGQTSADTTASGTSDTTTVSAVESAIGFPKENNNDETVTIIMGDHSQYEFMVEEQSGDIVEDAVYNRNRAVEEYLGVTLEFESRPSWSNAEAIELSNLITNSVAAGDDAYQLVSGISAYMPRLIANNVCTDLYTISTINFDNPWWVEGKPLNGKLFYSFNDAAFSMYKDFYCMFFNKNLIENMNLADPYEYALSGKWTIDKFISLAKDNARDLNGDSVISVDSDQISYVFKHAANRAFMPAIGCSIFEEKNGEYTLASLPERLFDTYEMLKDFIFGNTAVSCSTAASYGDVAKPFIEGRSLFMTNCLSTVEFMRDMKDDFGILPMPKYDENQEKYITQIATSTSAFYIPKTAGNPELVGKVCEVMGCYTREDVIPAYYEVALKDKFSRDEQTREIIEIIRESAVSSFEFAYSVFFAAYPNNIMNLALEGKELTSYYESNKSAWEATLAEIVAMGEN